MTPLEINAEYILLGYLVNALWQIPLVFVAAWGAAGLTRRNGPAAEHRVWVAAIFLEAAIPACRLDVGPLWREALAWLLPAKGAATERVGIALTSGAAYGPDGLRLTSQVLLAGVLAFTVITMYFAARLSWGIRRTEALRRRAYPASLEGDAAEVWRRLGANWLGGSRRMPALSVSPAVTGPVTVGLWRPAVLVPPGFLERLRLDDLEAVLAHELAHVGRLDFAKNFVYEAVSIAIAWHPIARLTRARLAESRELLCDAIAADAVAGRERYARSLLRLASMISHRAPAKTLHAIGIFDANSFERRVMNLTRKRVEMKRMQRIGIAAACALVALGTCATALALRVEVEPRTNAVSGRGAEGTPGNSKVDVTTMKSVSKTAPVYPAEAKANKDTVGGPVVLEVTIGKDGCVESIHLLKSLRKDYDRSAIDAVKTWRWEPYLVNGEPTEVDTTVTVTYSAPHDKK